MPLREVLQRLQDRIMNVSTYFGISTLKSPVDFWVYQEILFETRPDYIIEIGNYCGGSTLALAHICDQLKNGHVIGLDITHEYLTEAARQHPRITFIEGDACERFDQVRAIVDGARVMVIEDSSHTYENTLSVLRLYSQLIQSGDYFIVEDSICYHGLEVGPNPGPYEAIEGFLLENPRFEDDRTRESFLITWNPKGYLKRV
ncbi:MAG TPA: CmcI family methyltransferase [Pyrinomonadaceae bacterium]|nr:CmcI family methyltransferase [Pyrinomonadaceae bacterium]